MIGMARRLYAVPALEKGLDLLEALAADPRALTQAELARALGRRPGEIFRMLSCLERRGYLAKEADSGRYRPTLRLLELAHAHSPVEPLLRAASVPMRELARETEESCHLSVLARGEVLVIAQEESPRRVRLSVSSGGRFPALRTASGRVLLAHLPAGELDGLLAADPEWAAFTDAERRRFLQDLIGVRRTGTYVGPSDLTEGIRDAAAFVGQPRAGVAAALCIPSLTAVGRPLPVARLREAVRGAALEITRRLGLGMSVRQSARKMQP
jgi:DNA-binding IclR family transcriptional regulator